MKLLFLDCLGDRAKYPNMGHFKTHFRRDQALSESIDRVRLELVIIITENSDQDRYLP